MTFTANVTSAGGTPDGTVDFEDTTTSTDFGPVDLVDGHRATGGLEPPRRDARHHRHLQRKPLLRRQQPTTSTRSSNKSDTTTTITNDLTGHTDAGSAYNVAVEVDPVVPGDGTPGRDGHHQRRHRLVLPHHLVRLVSGPARSPTPPRAPRRSRRPTAVIADFNGSASSGTSHMVDPAPTTTRPRQQPQPVGPRPAGEVHCVCGWERQASGTPTGTVDFKDAGATIDSETLVSGMATFTTSALTTASHPITVFYEGDSNYASSTSTLVTQVVGQAATTTAVSSVIRRHPAPTPSAPRSPSLPTSWSPPLASASRPAPSTSRTGPRSSAAAPWTARVTRSTRPAPWPSARTRSRPYTRTTRTSSTSTSPGITQTVGKATPTVSVSSGENPSIYGDDVTFSATVTGSLDTPTRDGHLQVRRRLHRLRQRRWQRRRQRRHLPCSTRVRTSSRPPTTATRATPRRPVRIWLADRRSTRPR